MPDWASVIRAATAVIAAPFTLALSWAGVARIVVAAGVAMFIAVLLAARWLGMALQVMVSAPPSLIVALFTVAAFAVVLPFTFCAAASCFTEDPIAQRRGIVAMIVLGLGLSVCLGAAPVLRGSIAAAFAIPGGLAADSLRRLLIDGDTLSVTSQWGGLGGGLGGWRCSRSLSMLAVLCICAVAVAAALYVPAAFQQRV